MFPVFQIFNVYIIIPVLVWNLVIFLKKDYKVLNQKNILVVIAHPDDECMFFAPSMLALSPKNNIQLLCLSNGANLLTRKRRRYGQKAPPRIKQ
jgi:N-acetylglucosaminylphosphatidylinositol deacetylase